MSLHNEIMNIQVKATDGQRYQEMGSEGEHCYKIGHRDARHAAAELSLKYEALIEDLSDALANLSDSDYVDRIKGKHNV
jgi:hypothetical protein